MSMATVDHLAWLQEKLSGYESKLSEAEATVAKLRPLVSNLRDIIAALIAEHQGPTPQRDIFGAEHLVEDDLGNTGSTKKPFIKGNQSPKMPNRRPEFANRTLIEAASQVINSQAGAIHANDVTEAVFVISNKADFALAKHSMASELYRGAKKGLWIALGNNRYQHD